MSVQDTPMLAHKNFMTAVPGGEKLSGVGQWYARNPFSDRDDATRNPVQFGPADQTVSRLTRPRAPAYHEFSSCGSDNLNANARTVRGADGQKRVRDGESLTARPPAEDHLPRRGKNRRPARLTRLLRLLPDSETTRPDLLRAKLGGTTRRTVQRVPAVVAGACFFYFVSLGRGML